MLDFDGIQTRDLPRGFKGELRPYQKAGFDWLHFLHEYEFGGCLADDMGLGKTIQGIGVAELLSRLAGVQKVLVNGAFVVRNGELILDAPHGQPIRRVVVE